MWFKNKFIIMLCIVSLSNVTFVSAEPLAIKQSSSVTLSSLTQQVYETHPALHNELAQQQQIEAYNSLANQIFAEPSTLSLTHQNDGLGSNHGLQEWESNVHMPVWLPGQKQQQRDLAEKMAAVLPAYLQQIKLDASAKVRELIWNAVLADNHNKQAYQAWQTALKLEQDVTARVKAGELAATDRLLANNNVIELQSQYLMTAAELKHALTQYQQFTGKSVLPEQYEEVLHVNIDAEPTLAELVTLIQSHPAMQLADQEIETLRAKQGLARYDGAINPSLSLGVRRERSSDNEAFTNSIGVGISFALNNDAYHRPAIADAARELADAEIARQTLERQLSIELFGKLHDIETKKAQLILANEQNEASQRYLTSQKRAFELGEIDLANVLRSQSLAKNAQNQAQRLQIEIKQLTAEINQASGKTL